jgi:hypothetical protein
VLRSGSDGPGPPPPVEEVVNEGPGILDTEADPASGDGRGLEERLGINMDLVPSTNRPPRGGTSAAGLGMEPVEWPEMKALQRAIEEVGRVGCRGSGC